jgi:hypothetical protein
MIEIDNRILYEEMQYENKVYKWKEQGFGALLDE